MILAYHRVASPPSDPQLLAVPPSRFEEQLAALRAHFDPASLSGLAEALESGRRPAGVVLTFDDGYGDNLHEALPLLERYDWPATVFVTTGYVGGAREFWWDELERILLVPSQLPDTLSLTVSGRRRTWDTRVSSDGPSNAASAWNSRGPFLTPRLGIPLIARCARPYAGSCQLIASRSWTISAPGQVWSETSARRTGPGPRRTR